MNTEPTDRLRQKLCRELAQSEHDARLHTRREAKRLGDIPPADALLAIARHSDIMNEVLEVTCPPTGVKLGRAVGEFFSATRHFVVDRFLDSERSFRMTLLGLEHGVDVARLLRVVAADQGHVKLALVCDELVRDRSALIDQARYTLSWFAANPALALT